MTHNDTGTGYSFRQTNIVRNYMVIGQRRYGKRDSILQTLASIAEGEQREQAELNAVRVRGRLSSETLAQLRGCVRESDTP